MPAVYFISHPEVVVDRAVLVPEWDLSKKGRLRLELLVAQPWIATIGAVFSSNERKARTAARRIAGKLGLEVHFIGELGEMDRSSTGMLEQAEFDQVVEQFFAAPNDSVRGWETAVAAQDRIIAAVERVEAQTPADLNVAIVSHGGVGTLLLTHIKGASISRTEDQPSQGHYFVFDRTTRTLTHGWMPIDHAP